MSHANDMARVEAMNNICSAMMDAAMPLLRKNPPDVAFDAVMCVLFFVGEHSGHSPEQVAALAKDFAEKVGGGEVDA